MIDDWRRVDPKHFEKFVYYTVSKLGYRNREWFGKGGGDRGRDVIAYSFEELPFNLGYQRKWIFQCKRWLKFPSKSIILNEILTANQHSPDFWVIVIPVDLTASQIDYLESLDKNYPFKVLFIPLVAIEEIIYKYPETMDILINGELPEGSLE